MAAAIDKRLRRDTDTPAASHARQPSISGVSTPFDCH